MLSAMRIERAGNDKRLCAAAVRGPEKTAEEGLG